MSVISCDICEKLFDSDDDRECFCEVPDYAPAHLRGAVRPVTMCEPCREAEHQRLQEALER